MYKPSDQFFYWITSTSGIDFTFNQSLTNPTVTVQNQNTANGMLQVVIAETETSKEIASVAVAAWSQEKQKNIHWYTTSSVVNGKVVVTADEKYHHNISGNYTVHAYVKNQRWRNDWLQSRPIYFNEQANNC